LIQVQAASTKAVADTFNIKDQHQRAETIKSTNTMAKYLINDIGVSKSSKKDQKDKKDSQLLYL